MTPTRPDSHALFEAAVSQLTHAQLRDDLAVREIPAPTGLAPDVFAVAGDVRPDAESGDSVYGTGRFLLFHDPQEPDSWGGPWRIVCFAQAPLDAEIGLDPLVADVAWSWLVDALSARGARYHSPAGTATKTLSKGFGSLSDEGEGAQIELRASWSPEIGFDLHLEAWAELVCMLAGLPPGSERIDIVRMRERTRG